MQSGARNGRFFHNVLAENQTFSPHATEPSRLILWVSLVTMLSNSRIMPIYICT
uniref:Uncharacterized protein n=1 Tax=mine drainage metagenome TaxID=410659 RepID=E6QLX9_9ZZZZ